jgi:hypothetical protein
LGRTKKLSTDEKLEIINNNPILWFKNFIKIIDNAGNQIPFVVNDEQAHFLKNMGKFNIIAKSRQIGFTTLSLALMLYSAITKDNTTYLILSYNDESVNNIFERLRDMYNSIPEKYRIEQKINNRDMLILKNGSKIYVKVAGNKTLGRSFTCHGILCSEFAFWDDKQQEKGLVALEQALAKNDDSWIIIETTSNGFNHYYELFMSAYKGRSKYKAFFYNWYQNKKQFDTEYRLAEAWYKSENHGVRLSQKELDPYEAELYKKGASLLQLMWRRWKLQDMKLEDFQQEFPSTPEESFIATNTSVFDASVINARYQYLLPYIKHNELKKPLPESLLRYYGKSFFIYQDIKPGEHYYIGVDTGAGLGSDYSACCIFSEDGEQVGVFYDNKLATYKYAKIVYDIGMYFGYAMLIIERNSYGLDVINKLRKDMGYINILKFKRFDKITGKHQFDYGFYTDSTSKTILVNDLREQFDEGGILINDPETLNQFKIFQENKGKYEAIKGEKNFDDLVIAAGLGVQGLKSGKWYL